MASISAFLHAVTLFPAGLFAGSLIATVSYRWPLGIHPFRPPGFCPRCNASLKLVDMIPVIGFFLRRGRCRDCGARIHPLYPAVETAAGLLWAYAGYTLSQQPIAPLGKTLLILLVLAFIAGMLLVAIVDWHHRVIPDGVTLPGILVALMAAPALPTLHHAESAAAFSRYHPVLAHFLPGQQPWRHAIACSVAGALTGLALGLAIHGLGTLTMRKQMARHNTDAALGMGDVKLLVFIGAFLGWKNVAVAVGVAAIAGVMVGALRKMRTGTSGRERGWRGLKNRWHSGASILPFGPFLALAAIACLFWGEKIEVALGFY